MNLINTGKTDIFSIQMYDLGYRYIEHKENPRPRKLIY